MIKLGLSIVEEDLEIEEDTPVPLLKQRARLQAWKRLITFLKQVNL
jgi:hypothetical protein